MNGSLRAKIKAMLAAVRLRDVRLPRWVRNRYFLVIVLGGIWIGFFDEESFYVQYQYRKQYNKLEKTLRYYRNEVKRMDSVLKRLESSTDLFFIEQYAREHYLCKRPGETIYLLPDAK